MTHTVITDVTARIAARSAEQRAFRAQAGSWLTPADAVQRGDWARISNLASVAVELSDPTMRKV
jgi:2-keto-3-deoxy-6-phosphogluconate aldolase